MSMTLTRILDPRDNLARASRDELYDFAKAQGVQFDQRTATKQYMEQVLRDRGLVDLKVAVRFQGKPTGEFFSPNGAAIEPEKIATVDAHADMVRQMKEQAAQPNDREKPPAEMSIGELRRACKQRGIKMDRRDNMNALREKLGGQNPA